MDFKPLELTDKPLIYDMIKTWGYENTESSFANLYMWRHYMKLEFCICDGALFFLMERKGEKYSFVPITGTADSICRHMQTIINYFDGHGWKFRAYCTDVQRERLLSHCGEKMLFKELPQSNEYIYDAECLRTLSGKTYQKKRNHINNFLKNYGGRFEYQKLCESHLDECMELYDAWLENSIQDDYINYERDTVVDAISKLNYLNLCGAAIRIDGRLEAFTVGERLTKDMALIHIEKANRDINGLYPFINQQFLIHAFPDVTYVNREEDLGLEGLRKAKMSYYPIRFIHKYGVRLK